MSMLIFLNLVVRKIAKIRSALLFFNLNHFNTLIFNEINPELGLEEEIIRQNFENLITLKIFGPNHVISIGYLPKTKEWVYNNFLGTEVCVTDKKEKLAPLIFNSYAKASELPLAFRIFSTQEDATKLGTTMHALEQHPKWKSLHSIKPERISSFSQDNASHVYRKDKIKELVKADKIIKPDKKSMAAGAAIVLCVAVLAIAVVLGTISFALVSIATTLFLGQRIYSHSKRAIDYSKNSKKIETTVLANTERDEKSTLTSSASIQKKVSGELKANSSTVDNDFDNHNDTPAPANQTKSDSFTQEHYNYLRLQQNWARIRQTLPKRYGNKNEIVTSMKPGIFFGPSKNNEYLKYSNAINSILTQKFDANNYYTQLTSIRTQLMVLVNPKFKAQIQSPTYGALTLLNNQVQNLISLHDSNKPKSALLNSNDTQKSNGRRLA